MSVEKEKITIKSETKTTIRGYGIQLNDEKLTRIDQMVESYEQRVAARLDEDYEHHTRRSDRVADKVAAFGGSWTFIIIFACFLLVWITINLLPFLGMQFDPKPFILLNLILSIETWQRLREQQGMSAEEAEAAVCRAAAAIAGVSQG